MAWKGGETRIQLGRGTRAMLKKRIINSMDGVAAVAQQSRKYRAEVRAGMRDPNGLT